MPAPENKKYTADEFFNITKDADTERYELYKGEIIVLASPSIIHQRISREVSYALNSFIKSSGGKCEVFTAPTDVKLSEDTVVIPDIFIACDPDKFDKQKYNGAPDFIIEITSSNRSDDFIRKLAVYLETGVREYWIVDPDYKKVLVYFFEESHFPNIYTFDVEIPVNIYNKKCKIKISELIK